MTMANYPIWLVKVLCFLQRNKWENVMMNRDWIFLLRWWLLYEPESRQEGRWRWKSRKLRWRHWLWGKRRRYYDLFRFVVNSSFSLSSIPLLSAAFVQSSWESAFSLDLVPKLSPKTPNRFVVGVPVTIHLLGTAGDRGVYPWNRFRWRSRAAGS